MRHHEQVGLLGRGPEFDAAKEALVRQLEADLERGETGRAGTHVWVQVETCARGKLLFLRNLARLPLPVAKVPRMLPFLGQPRP
jgi:hypothetical protein